MTHNVPEFSALWVYLAASPLLGLTMTLCAYVGAHWLYSRSGFSPFVNPVPIAIAIIALILVLTGMSYRAYFSGAQFVHFLLGPATVALAIPLARQLPRLRRSFVPLLGGLLAGSATAMISAVAIMAWMGGSRALAISIGPKSATVPIAMGVSEKLGGVPALTAMMVIATGIFGAMVARHLFDWMHIRGQDVRGLAMGVSSHGIGTARAFQVHPEMGAFAGLGMGLNGVLTAFMAPWLIPVILRVLTN